MVIGLVMIYSISSMIAESRFGSHLFFFGRQIVWMVLALTAAWLISRMDIERLAVWSLPVLMVTYVLLILVFAMPARNEAHRWIYLGPLTVQPSELFKFALIAFMAYSLSRPDRDLSQLRQLLLPYGPIIGLGLGLILIEPDLGNTIVIAITVIGILFLAGARLTHLFTAAAPMAAMGAFVVFVLGYKKARIMDYLASVADPLNGSYQAKQAALTLGSGGIMGMGLGDGRQKLFFLPYPHTDFIFAAAGEEVGFIGLLIILTLFFLLLRRGMRIAAAQPDKFGYLLASGMTLSLFINIAINIGVVTSLLPVTGLPLPFISYGGSSLLISSAAVGVLLNLSRRITA
jgi:cell division protein FtsW